MGNSFGKISGCKKVYCRTDADLSVTPALWVPATDFSDVFNYVDLRESGVKSVADVWQV